MKFTYNLPTIFGEIYRACSSVIKKRADEQAHRQKELESYALIGVQILETMKCQLPKLNAEVSRVYSTLTPPVEYFQEIRTSHQDSRLVATIYHTSGMITTHTSIADKAIRESLLVANSLAEREYRGQRSSGDLVDIRH